MSIAHSVMLLVTLLFVLTTRGITLDFHRHGARAEWSPVSSPRMKRVRSAFSPLQDQSENEGVLDQPNETPRMNLNWRNFPPSRDSVQSAPASPPSLLRHWNTPPASSLNRFRTLPDDDNMQNSDSEYTHLSAAGLGTGSFEQFFETTGEEGIEDLDYPTPSSNEELYD
jgi:hypothetical protein